MISYTFCSCIIASSRGFVGVPLLAAGGERKGHKAWGRWVLLLFPSTLCSDMVAKSRCFVGEFLLAAAGTAVSAQSGPCVAHGWQVGPAALPIYLVWPHDRIFSAFGRREIPEQCLYKMVALGVHKAGKVTSLLKKGFEAAIILYRGGAPLGKRASRSFILYRESFILYQEVIILHRGVHHFAPGN